MVSEADWIGTLGGRRGSATDVVLAALEPNTQPSSGGSQPILAIGKDSKRYWMKLRASGQGDRVPVTEQIVGRAGALIGAPTCPVFRMQITTDHAGVAVSGGRTLSIGIEHASADIQGGGWFGGDGVDRSRDDNSKRMVGWFALFDWCWGGDAQGLQDPHDDARLFSHDHGHYFPPGSGTWTADGLRQNVDVPHEAPFATAGCDRDAVIQYASAIRAVGRHQIRDAVAAIPLSWNVSDLELEVVGYFLERRAPFVADRLLARFGATP